MLIDANWRPVTINEKSRAQCFHSRNIKTIISSDVSFVPPRAASSREPRTTDGSICYVLSTLPGWHLTTSKTYRKYFLPRSSSPGVNSMSEQITLSELPLKDWSARECTLCTHPFYARTGICISCDAGLCKNVFHVLWYVSFRSIFQCNERFLQRSERGSVVRTK